MFNQNEYVAMRINQDAHDRAFAEAEKIRALRQAGLIQPGSIARLASRGAGSLGRVFLTLGQRLVNVEASTLQSAAFHPSTGD